MSNVAKLLPDDAMVRHMAQVFQIMGDETRLKILRSLMSGPQTVNAIVVATDQSQANVSKHLAIMLKGGLLGRRKEGTRVWYSIVDPMVHALCDAVCRARAGAVSQSNVN